MKINVDEVNSSLKEMEEVLREEEDDSKFFKRSIRVASRSKNLMKELIDAIKDEDRKEVLSQTSMLLNVAKNIVLHSGDKSLANKINAAEMEMIKKQKD